MAEAPVTLDLSTTLPLERRGRGWVVALPERDVPVSNPGKLLWGEEGYTKADLLAYLHDVADRLLPFLRDRPLMVRRMPDGIDAEGFYAKRVPSHAPDWVRTAAVTAVEDGSKVDYVLAQDEATLLWLGNLGAIDLHPWHARVDDLGRPDYAFFDLDPKGTSFEVVREVALLVGDALDHLGLVGVPRTSGATGMQVLVPIEREHSAATVRAFVHAVCRHLHRVDPARTTLRFRVSDRPSAVYLDYGMNAEGRSLVATYSPRPERAAPVATPLTWEEVEAGIHPRDFTIATVGSRLDALVDPGVRILAGGQDLHAALAALGLPDDDGVALHRVEARPSAGAGLAPMLAVAGRSGGFDDPGWLFEMKWDGVRALATVTTDDGGSLRLESRAGNDLTAQYPEIAEIVAQVLAGSVVLDGELVAFDPDGAPSFQLLQRRMHQQGPSASLTSEVPVTYVVFDLLAVDGELLVDRPLAERLARLDEVLAPDAPVMRSAGVRGEGRAMFAEAARRGLEGVVAKRLSSRYRPGRRSPDWVKLKVRRRTRCVVGGWTPGRGSRSGRFASLLLGVHEEGRLRFVGRVGTGFTDPELARVRALLDARASGESPFESGPSPPRDARWVRPELSCVVEYAEVTADGLLRAPAYKGLDPEPGSTPADPG